MPTAERALVTLESLQEMKDSGFSGRAFCHRQSAAHIHRTRADDQSEAMLICNFWLRPAAMLKTAPTSNERWPGHYARE